jgi:hypothetical protein
VKLTLGQLRTVLAEADPRDPELAAIPPEVRIRSVSHGATPGDRKTRTWVGNRDQVNIGLIMTDMPREDRLAVLRGDKSIGDKALQVLKKRGAVTLDKPPAAPKAPAGPKQPRLTRQGAENRLSAAIKSFARNWTNFTQEMPDVQPEDAAWDAAGGFFYEYPEWEKWVRAMWDPYGFDKRLTKTEVQERVADYVHDAMMKGAERAAKQKPKAPPKETYKVYGKLKGAPAHTRVKGKAYLAPADTQFKPGEPAVATPDGGKLSVKKKDSDHTQVWEPE